MVATGRFMKRFRDFKLECESGNWFSFDGAIDGPAVVYGRSKFIATGVFKSTG